MKRLLAYLFIVLGLGLTFNVNINAESSPCFTLSKDYKNFKPLNLHSVLCTANLETVNIQGKKYSISSFIVKNENGNILSCSFVEPSSDTDRTGDYMPCVVYGHGNAGNKLEGL